MNEIALPQRSRDPLAAKAWHAWRWVPFWVAALGSVAMSCLAPDGRKPFHIDWDVSLASLHFSFVKGPHIGAAMLLALLAVIGAQRQRLWLAFVLTVMVGWGWEMGQTTVIGHQARLADLLPDAIGALLGCAWGACVLWLVEQPRHAFAGAGMPRATA